MDTYGMCKELCQRFLRKGVWNSPAHPTAHNIPRHPTTSYDILLHRSSSSIEPRGGRMDSPSATAPRQVRPRLMRCTASCDTSRLSRVKRLGGCWLQEKDPKDQKEHGQT